MVENGERFDPGQTARGFRTRASIGVALAAMLLLAPFAFVNLWFEQYAIALGTLGIVMSLFANAVLSIRQRAARRLFLCGLVPLGMLFMTQVFRNDGIVGSVWCYPAILACYCILPEREAWVANAVILVVAVPMVLITLDPVIGMRIIATLLAVGIFSAILVRVIDEQYRQMYRQLRHDPLTGLRNRLSLNETLEALVAGPCAAAATPHTLLALDLDHFKSVNDTYGHDRGDRVLMSLGELLRETLPVGTPAFRIGGEEFFVLLAEHEEIGAQIAERLRRDVQRRLSFVGRTVTISVGVAGYRAGETRQSWMQRADRRLYAAKRAGRNRIDDGTDDAPVRSYSSGRVDPFTV